MARRRAMAEGKRLKPAIENRRLKIIEPRIEAPGHDLAIRVAAVIAELLEAFEDSVVVGHNGSAVAQASEHLGGIKTDRAGRAEGSRRLAAEARSQRLGGVFDDRQRVPLREFSEGFHIRRAAV